MPLDGLSQQWGIPLVLYSDRHAAFKYNARQVPVPVESTQFRQGDAKTGHPADIRPLSTSQGKSGANGGNLPGPSGHRSCVWSAPAPSAEANEALRDFLPRFNAKFAVSPKHSGKVYRPVSAEMSLTETVCIKHTRKVARDNPVKYHWRLLQLLREADRPSYAGLLVEVLERANGELTIKYHG